MRRSPVALALVAVALTAAACGGSGKSRRRTLPARSLRLVAMATQPAFSRAIDTQAATGPQKLKLDLTVDIKGSPKDAQLAVFTKQPIQLGLDGVVDATGKSGDVNVSVTLGDTPIEAEIRYGGGKSWIQIDGKWYDLPADALSSTTGQSLPSGTSVSSLDAGKILAAIGDPSKLLERRLGVQ